MSLNAPPAAAPARPDCGCGGCGGTGTADLSAAAFVRPRFFAGQLLTEDDLGLLTGYVTAKDRLHNRYLFGAGVVCGLRVTCDPCGGGTVSVQPGYALDCCGSDLVLACPTTLDINAMIRDLRAARLGKDCGDPCADQDTQSAGRRGTAITRHYCLYARYGEQATDPVAPYATEEPCGQTTCEPTRIREGISFVLKCPEHEPPPDDLWGRLKECLPHRETLGHAGRLLAYGEPMAAAAHAAAHPPAFGQQETDELNKILAASGGQPRDTGTDQARSMTETVRQLAAVLARYDLAKDRPQLNLTKARAALGDMAAALRDSVTATWDDPFDRAAVHALLEQAAKLATATTQPRVKLAMLAEGRPLDDSLLAVLTSDATALAEWLRARVDSDPALTDCELRSQVSAVSVAAATASDAPAIRRLGQAGSGLIKVLTRWLADCICTALNPPCVPCEDTDVLLACLEVRDCEVVRICNAERDYVISGSALRYWLPAGFLHEHIERFCCQDKPSIRPASEESGGLSFQQAGFGAAEAAASLPWELLGLPQPADLLRGVLQRAGAALPAPAAPVTPAAPPAAEAADATARQLTALTERVSELTGQLTETQTRLAETQAQLTGLANRPSAAPRPAGRARRTAAAKSPTGQRPAATGAATTGPDSPEADDGT
jgi:hypothetical protein